MRLGCKVSGSKETLRGRIRTMQHLLSDRPAFRAQLSKIDGVAFRAQAAHHDAYAHQFNGVDCHNKMWYSAHYNFHVDGWRAKFVLSLLGTLFVNCFVLFCEDDEVEQFSFFDEIANQMCAK